MYVKASDSNGCPKWGTKVKATRVWRVVFVMGSGAVIMVLYGLVLVDGSHLVRVENENYDGEVDEAEFLGWNQRGLELVESENERIANGDAESKNNGSEPNGEFAYPAANHSD